MGWENVFHVEKDEFCQAVLKKNFPEVVQHGDIKTFDGTKYRGAIDIITGGFPCQPYSVNGKRLGTDDPRHLWPEMLRVIREIQPSWIVGENVGGLLNWSNGLVFEMVCVNLEDEGYQVTPYILPAAGAGAPHRRDRCWFIAHSNGNDAWGCGYGKTGSTTTEGETKWEKRERIRSHSKRIGSQGAIANASNGRLSIGDAEPIQGKSQSTNKRLCGVQGWGNFPTQSGICRRDDGVPNRMERIKSLGNSIVPQVAFQIFKAIEATNQTIT
jgi:DNA (cytosine-5)-methyltransferase 1